MPPPSLGPLLDAAVTTLLVLAATVLPALPPAPHPAARVCVTTSVRRRGPSGSRSDWRATLGVFLTWRMDDLQLGIRAGRRRRDHRVLAVAVRASSAPRPHPPPWPHAWRQGIAAVARHPTLALVQTVGFGRHHGLLLLSVVRTT